MELLQNYVNLRRETGVYQGFYIMQISRSPFKASFTKASRMILKSLSGHFNACQTRYPDDSIWDAVMKSHGFSYAVKNGSVDSIPQTGPVIVACNHPFDGLIAASILGSRRDDFMIVSNALFNGIEQMKGRVLPILYRGDALDRRVALKTIKSATEHVNRGGALLIFPAGAVAAKPRWYDYTARERDWQPMLGHLVKQTRAPVVPIVFSGQNSMLFQLASHASLPLSRLAIMLETLRMRSKPVHLSIGQPILPESIPENITLSRAIAARVQDLAFSR